MDERLERLRKALTIITGENTRLRARVEIDASVQYMADEHELMFRIKEKLAQAIVRPLTEKIRLEDFDFERQYYYGREFGREVHYAEGIILDKYEFRFIQRILNELIREEQFRANALPPEFTP